MARRQLTEPQLLLGGLGAWRPLGGRLARRPTGWAAGAQEDNDGFALLCCMREPAAQQPWPGEGAQSTPCPAESASHAW